MTPKQKEVMILINKKIREDKEVNSNPELENIRLSRNHINELLSYISSIQQEIAVKMVQQKLEI
jgi:hypothetical protein